jgi:hypothetical protein
MAWWLRRTRRHNVGLFETIWTAACASTVCAYHALTQYEGLVKIVQIIRQSMSRTRHGHPAKGVSVACSPILTVLLRPFPMAGIEQCYLLSPTSIQQENALGLLSWTPIPLCLCCPFVYCPRPQ